MRRAARMTLGREHRPVARADGGADVLGLAGLLGDDDPVGHDGQDGIDPGPLPDTAGNQLELSAIAAAVLGGTSLFGGQGTIIGTLVGAIILSVLLNGLILMGVPFFFQLVATGSALVLAVAFNEALRPRT